MRCQLGRPDSTWVHSWIRPSPPEGPNPLLEVCTALLQAEVNIVQAYPLMIRPHGRPAVALMVDNLEMAQETLKAKWFTMISERDLMDDE